MAISFKRTLETFKFKIRMQQALSMASIEQLEITKQLCDKKITEIRKGLKKKK